MRRVLFIVGYLSAGGAEIQLYHLVTHIRKYGYDPHVAVLLPGGSIESWYRDKGIPLIPLHQHRHLHHVRRLTELHRCIRTLKPDIVHNKLMDANLSGGLAALMAGHRRIIYTELGPGVKPTLRMRFFRRFLSRTGAATVCNSRRVGERLTSRWPIPRLVVIPNGLDPRWFSDAPSYSEARAALNLPEDAWIVATVSHFVYKKNPDMFIEVAERVLQKLPNAYFVYAGTGPLRSRCEERATALGIRDRLRILGEIPDTKPLLQAADAFVLTSRSEGLPNALMEAEASRRPCVATDVGGCPELIASDEMGMLVPSEDSHAMADALISLHDNPTWAAGLGSKAQEHMASNFSLEGMVAATATLYDQLLGDEVPSNVPHPVGLKMHRDA